VLLTLTPSGASAQLPEVAAGLLDASARERRRDLIASRPPSWGPLFPDGQPGTYARLVVSFIRAGGLVAVGSDAGNLSNPLAGFRNHEVLKNLVRLGLLPLEAIRIATLSGATFLHIQDRTGRIEVGKEADILIIRGDPAEHIEDIDNLETVFNNGVAYDPNALLDEVRGQVGWK
jgi:hypothetical protein